MGLVEKIKLPQKCDSPVPRASAVHWPADRAGGVVGQGGLHVQGQGGLDLLHGGEHRDEEHGNGRHKQVYITIIIIIVFMVIIIVFFIVYHQSTGGCTRWWSIFFNGGTPGRNLETFVGTQNKERKNNS